MNLAAYSLQTGVALALMYLFYRAVLQRLTFYRANRFYLAGYTLLALVIPFYNTGGLLPQKAAALTVVYHRVTTSLIPATTVALPAHPPVAIDWTWCILVGGMAIMLIRLLVQVFSLLRLWTEATLIGHSGGSRVYRLPYPLAPFSFGPNIFLSPETETSPDLARIIEHEQVHIRQAHTLDILLGQLLLVLQWWNPVVWLLNRSIRQNLEFLADRGVLDRGADRKEYQYLLLSVSGQGVPSLSNPLNFSPLKNRITMMNKQRSTGTAGARFLFALPLLLVLLAAAGRYPGRPDAVYHFQGFVVNAHTYDPVAGATVKDEQSGRQTTTDVNGYFRIDFPRGKEAVTLKISVSGAGLETANYGSGIAPPKPGSIETHSFDCIGVSPAGPEAYNFVRGTPTDDEQGLLRKDPASLRNALDHAVSEEKESRKVQAVFDSSPHIYYQIDGRSYVISPNGGYACWDMPVDLVLVNGKIPMTGSELNKRYNKHQVKWGETVNAKDAEKKFGINKNLFVVNVDTTASL